MTPDDEAQPANRYFNPPSEILIIGRQLEEGSFADLLAQLKDREVLFGLYWNQQEALVAIHLHSENLMAEMNQLYGPTQGYYALPIDKANRGLKLRIPET